MVSARNLAEPIKGRLDVDGRLVSADPLLLRLHLHCGGFEGGPLAIPQLANLCRLSKKLGMNLSRSVKAADDENTISLWAETRIEHGDEGGLSISIIDWRETPLSVDVIDDEQRRRDFDRLNARGTIRTDTALRITSISLPGNIRLSEEAIGNALLDVFSVVKPSRTALFAESVAERQPVRNHHVKLMSEPEQKYVLSGQPLVDNLGVYSGYRFSVEKLNDDNETLENSTNAKPSLISDSLFGNQLGPALRQPLGKIIANAETIGSQLEGPLRGDYASYAKDIAAAGRHLMDLVNDLSDLEAIERPEFTVAPDEIDLVDLAHRASGLLAVKAADHQIRVDLPDADSEMPALGEFRRVLQILVNLLGNAIRYSPDGSVIKIRVDQKDDQARISVSDQGDGIPEEDHGKIFDKFERLGRSGDGGSGLGLFISRRLANAMSGSLTVKSTKGKGATFTLSLPLRTKKESD